MIRKTRAGRALSAFAVVAALGLSLSACGSDSSSDETSAATSGSDAKGTEGNPVKIGVVGAADEQWPIFQELAEKDGIYVEIVDFSDYQQPNPAVTQEQLDLNQFQHLQFLADYNVNTDEDLTPIGATAVYPLSLYSSKHETLEDIPEGGEIAVPNDPSNLARALLTLQDAGLIELTDGGSANSTEADVIADSSKVTVTPVDATQTAISLQSVDGAVVNNDFVTDAGLAPEDALFASDADSEGARPYINVWVSRAADKDNETYLKLVEIFRDPTVEAALQAASGGSAVIATQDGEELQGFLTEIEQKIRDAA